MSPINSCGPRPVYTIEDRLPGVGVHVVLLKTAALSGYGTRVSSARREVSRGLGIASTQQEGPSRVSDHP